MFISANIKNAKRHVEVFVPALVAMVCLQPGLLGQPSINNGGFDQDPRTGSGFSSDHLWKAPTNNQDLMNGGTMTIGANPNSHHSFYQSFGPDSAPYMLIVNATAPQVAGQSTLVWGQSVGCLIVDKTYRISAKARNAYADSPGQLSWAVDAPGVMTSNPVAWGNFA